MRLRDDIERVRREAEGMAAHSYLRKGRVPYALRRIVAGAVALEKVLDDLCYTQNIKYNSDQPRVPAGSPDGGQWTDGEGDEGDSVGIGPFRDAPDIADPPLRPVYPEVLIVPFLRTPRMISAVRAFISSGRRGASWTLGAYKSPKRWANQMEKRNWTPDDITHTIREGKKYPAPNYINPRNSAVRYQDPKTGRFVVRDEVTREILQLSGDDFIPKTLVNK